MSLPDRCRQVDNDTRFALVPTLETVFTGTPESKSVGGIATESIRAICGANNGLVANATYDLGLGVAVSVTEVTGARTNVKYDGFGRMSRMYRPDAQSLLPSTIPSLRVEYQLGSPLSLLHSETRDGATESDATNYHQTWAYIDGLGRTVVTLSEAEGVWELGCTPHCRTAPRATSCERWLHRVGWSLHDNGRARLEIEHAGPLGRMLDQSSGDWIGGGVGDLVEYVVEGGEQYGSRVRSGPHTSTWWWSRCPRARSRA